MAQMVRLGGFSAINSQPDQDRQQYSETHEAAEARMAEASQQALMLVHRGKTTEAEVRSSVMYTGMAHSKHLPTHAALCLPLRLRVTVQVQLSRTFKLSTLTAPRETCMQHMCRFEQLQQNVLPAGCSAQAPN